MTVLAPSKKSPAALSASVELASLAARIELALSLDVPEGLPMVSAQEAFPAFSAEDESGLGWWTRASKSIDLVKSLPGIISCGKGTTRFVFSEEGANSVIKIADNREAARLNQLEVAYYERAAFYGYPVVPCRLVWLPTGMPAVIMEKVDTDDYDKLEAPRWGIQNDGGQVAISTMLGGVWAAYDATYPMTDSPLLGEHNGNYVHAANHEYAQLVTENAIAPEAESFVTV